VGKGLNLLVLVIFKKFNLNLLI
jgi:hypothetical protein